MKQRILFLIVLGLVAFQGTAQAAKFNYNQVSLGYLDQTVEMGGISGDLKANGYDLSASFEVDKQFAVVLGVGKASGDVTISGTKVKLDVDGKILGVIFHAPIAQKTDVVLGAALLLGEFKAKVSGFPTITEDMDGQNISLGIRTMLTDKLEVNAGVDQSYFDGETDTDMNLGIEGHLSKEFSLGLSYSSNDDSQATYLYVSKYF
jgi:long-subunit fatty acid transport protein